MTAYAIRRGNAPAEILVRGGTVTNFGPSTVYYADSQDVTTTFYEGTLTAGGTATLGGTQFFTTDGARASLNVVLPAAVENSAELEAEQEERLDALDAAISIAGGILVSPNGQLRRRLGIDNTGALVLLLTEDPPVLIATVVSATQIDLAWTDTTTNEAGFVLQRATNVDFTTGVVETSIAANTTIYSDTTVVAATTYYYRVKAIASGNLTEFSEAAFVTTPGSPAPPAIAAQRTNRSKYSKVLLFARLNETAGTAVAGQKHKLRYYSKAGFRNRRLSEDAEIDSLSSYYIPRLTAQATTQTNFTTFSSSIPAYEADFDTPKIHVTDHDGTYLDLDDSPYKWGSGSNNPWDPNWRPADAEDTSVYHDHSMGVVDPTADELREYFWVRLNATNPPINYPTIRANHGGRHANLSTFSGAYQFPFGVAGTGISILVGIIMLEEAALGEIPHTVTFSTALGTSFHRAPATRGDQSGGANDFPEGSIIRLPYNFDLAAYRAAHPAMSDLAYMVATAAREYGLICTDASTGTVGLGGQDIRNAATGWLPTAAPWYPYMQGTKTACTASASTDIVTATAHGLSNAQRIQFWDLVGGTPLLSSSAGRPVQQTYRAGAVTTNTFKVYLDSGLTQQVNLTDDIVSGSVAFVQFGINIFQVDRFPWSSMLLLPPVNG